MNVFRPINNGDVLPKRIMQGQSYKNYLFGANATIQDYKNAGLYLEVGEKPTYTQYQNCSLVSEVADHVNKEVILTWSVTDKSAEEIAEIMRLEDISTECTNSGLQYITIAQAEAWIDSRLQTAADAVAAVTNVASAKTAMNQILLAVRAINRKELPFFINGH